WFMLGSSSVWNGISMGAVDIAKRHTTRKRHVDVGLRVADYPTIQDYVGEAIIDTNACRVFALSIAEAFDRATDNNRKALQPGTTARAEFLHWAWQIKFAAAKNVAHVVDKMLHACGGSGYKRDMELERYLRDGKAGWVMGPTNEVLRQFVGKSALLGFEVLDYWNQHVNERAIANETKKLDAKGKRALAEKLLAQAAEDETKEPIGRGALETATTDRAQSAPQGPAGKTPARPRVVLPGLLPADSSLERYRVRPGAVTALQLAAGDELTVIDVDGRQRGELTVFGSSGEDFPAVGASADTAATTLRALAAAPGQSQAGQPGALWTGGLVAAALAHRGLDPAQARRVGRCGEW